MMVAVIAYGSKAKESSHIQDRTLNIKFGWSYITACSSAGITCLHSVFTMITLLCKACSTCCDGCCKEGKDDDKA